MAEMNELLDQAVDECGGLSAEVARAHETIDRMQQLATSLGEGIETGGQEAHRLLEQLNARLAEAEAEVAQQNAASLVGLQGLGNTSQDLHGQVEGFLRTIHADLAGLKAEKERVRGEVQHLGEAATGNIHGYGLHVGELEAASDSGHVSAREQMKAMGELVDDVRRGVAERREVLLASLRGIELSARQRLDDLVQTYDASVSFVSDQLLEVQTTLKSLSDQVEADVTRKLGQDALEVLRASADPLKEAMDDMEDFCKKNRSKCSDSFAEIVERVEEVTRTLEDLRQPLENVRQHLH